MIATARIIGLLNAAIWLGAAVFAAWGTTKAVGSSEMQALLTPRHYPYISGVVSELIAARYWDLHIVCSVVALFHLCAESLYFGKVIAKNSLALLLSLLLLGIAQEVVIQPAVKRLHLGAHAVNRTEVQKAASARGKARWQWASQAIYVLMVIGLGSHLWRVASPPDATRFLVPGKYRS